MQSETINELAAALAKAQAEIEGAAKDKVNPHFRSHYADLASVWDACRTALAKHGLAIVQTPDLLDSVPVLNTTLLHSSGQWVRSTLPLACDPKNMQALGSAITYARRYGLAAMVGVCPEDDDGNAAVTSTPPAREQHARDVVNHYTERRQQSAPKAPANGYEDKPPRTGKQLFAWAMKRKDNGDTETLKQISAWGKAAGLPYKTSEWPDDAVAECLAHLGGESEPAYTNGSANDPADEGDIPF